MWKTLAKVKKYNLNVTEVRDSEFKIVFPGIFNFNVGILGESPLTLPSLNWTCIKMAGKRLAPTFKICLCQNRQFLFKSARRESEKYSKISFYDQIMSNSQLFFKFIIPFFKWASRPSKRCSNQASAERPRSWSFRVHKRAEWPGKSSF